MKTAVRIGVFETNSSSTHTLMIMSKDALEKDRKTEKPKTRKFNTLTSKKDKLYMACGCCYEMCPKEDVHLEYNCTDDYDKAAYLALKNHEKIVEEIDLDAYLELYAPKLQPCGEDLYERVYSKSDFSYEVAMDYIVGVYCRLTGEDYAAVMKEVDGKNKSGRACHMKFFDEGALYDEDWDYRLICDLFDGTPSEIDANIAAYFDDDKVLCYREFYGGVNFDEDDD